METKEIVDNSTDDIKKEETNTAEVKEESGEETLQPPFFLGYRPNEFSITWHYDHMSLSRVGFMHPDYNHLFMQYVEKESRARGLKMIRINTELNPIQTNDIESFPLLDMELSPTFEGLNELEEIRMKWVQLYLKLLCYINEEDRNTFIPQLKYYRGQEGPLAGYVRSIEDMKDSKHKEVLLAHIRKLILVEWGLINNDTGDVTTDYVYTIKGTTFKEKLESFFIGCWCIINIHYSRDFEGEKPQQLLTLMQFGEDLLIEGLDDVARSLIEETVILISHLTLPSLDHLEINQHHALFIQSPLLFPNIYPSVSHMLYGVKKTRDFNLDDLIEGMEELNNNEALYRSSANFVKKVFLPVEY